MRKIFAVIRREFVERVRTKTFVIFTILGPIFFAALAIIPGLLLSRQSTGQRIAVVDAGPGDFGVRIETILAGFRKGPDLLYLPVRVPATGRIQEVVDSLVQRTGLSKQKDQSLDGLLIIDEGAVVTGKLRYYGKNVGSIADVRQLETVLTPLMISERLRSVGVDPAVAIKATTPVDLETRKVTEGRLTSDTGGSTFALAYGMGIILYMALVLYGTQVMNSVVEEKSNRSVEILVSSLTPFQMMLGKVVGVGLVSLLQLGIWAGAAYGLSKYQAKIMAFFGAGAAASAGPGVGSILPSMDPMLLAVFLIFFVLGFLFYSSAYAAIGSMCNTVQETQQAQMPIMMLTVTGWFSAFALLRDPTSAFAKVASLLPPLAPFVVPVRYSIAKVPLPDLLLSIGVMILGLLGIVWIAARIYRVGILMYGKRASFGDIVRWVRAG
jgi:ABC-2 type transport system permease protein